MQFFLSLSIVVSVLSMLSIKNLASAFRLSSPFTKSVAVRTNMARTILQASYTSHASGDVGSTNYRVHFKDGKGNTISPWHDIPLHDNKKDPADIFTFITEIPKNTKAKMEIATKEAHNPIAQDIKNNKLRDYHGPIYWNYGAFPQTWEDPNILHHDLKFKGDNDPLDAVEIGSSTLPTGSVVKVKVLGALAMIDDGELDWKVIILNTNDPLNKDIEDITDLQLHHPHVISGIREWFRWYKTPDNKPLNKFGYNEFVLNKHRAIEIIHETNKFWKDLVDKKTPHGKLWIPTK